MNTFSLPRIICFTISTLLTFGAAAQSNGWTANPFDQRVFVENKGQFDKSINEPTPVLFGANSVGTHAYFTANSVWYRHDVVVDMTPLEKAEVRKVQPNIEEERLNKSVPLYMKMEWVGANPNCKVETSGLVHNYFTYPKDGSVNTQTIIAQAYKKITYKNLYPNIDVEYIMPTDKYGYKYSIILHPGADLTKVKMKYSYHNSIAKDNQGNIVVQSVFGEFVDHAPYTFYDENNVVIPSSFELNGNVVSFKLQNYNSSKTVIVDPWTTNPAFPTWNRVYDVNYDQWGNVYAYGGNFPWQLAKLNNAGVIQWTYTAAAMYNSGCSTGACYGDCAVDEISGTCYLTEGFDWAAGSRVFKVNTLGVQTAASVGNPNFNEIWRAEYNRCINTIIGVGGGTTCCFQAILIDTNLTNMNPVNVYSTNQTNHDQYGLAIDPVANFCYMAEAYYGNPTNAMVKVPIPALLPQTWNTTNGFNFFEVGSVPYVMGATSNTNGFNALAASINWLYAYNGTTLKKFNKMTGAQLLQVATGGTMYATGGTTVDVCDNVYVGAGNVIKGYDPSLTQFTTINCNGTIYDVKMGPNNGKIYACGDGFVSELTVPVNTTTISASSSPNTNCSNCNGSATATVTICNQTVSNVGYSWSPGGQTTQTATGLCPGLYTVTISTGCNVTFSDTVTVGSAVGGGFTLNTTSTGANCSGGNATATATPVGGQGPFTYSWTTTPVQTTQTATGLGAGTYTCFVTDAQGCSNSTTVTVVNSPPVNLSLTGSTNPACFNACTGTATVNPTGGTGPFSFSWTTTPSQNGATATGLCAGTYTCYVTDAAGCSDTATVTLTQPTQVTVSSTPVTICNGQSTNLTATVAGGTPGYTVSWNPGALTGTTVSVSPTVTTTYTITVTDANGCTTAPVTVTVTVGGPLTLTASNPVAICVGSSTTLSALAGGGSGTYTYAWAPGGSTTSSITVNPTTTTTYTVTVNDNCGTPAQTDTVTVTVNQLPVITFAPNDSAGCVPLCVNFSNNTSNPQSSSWTFGDGGTSTATSPQYCYMTPGTFNVSLTVTDINGCSNTLTINQLINVYPYPTADFGMSAQQTSIIEPEICFTNLSVGASSISWNFGDPLASQNDNNSTQQNPCHTYSDTGTYCVTLYVTNPNGCRDTIDYCLYIGGAFTFYAPNAFTPDGTGHNDSWTPKGEGIDPSSYHLWIFDRWGNLIWDTQKWGEPWPGTANGGSEIVQEDVYVWKVKCKDIYDKSHEFVGHVSVIK
ncbi:MAG: PKD domain-containing protein [Bacteroidota bacterium]